MRFFRRLKRLWELSGTPSDVEDRQLAAQIKEEGDFHRENRKKERTQRLATILQDDPLDVFPSEEQLEENEQDNSDK